MNKNRSRNNPKLPIQIMFAVNLCQFYKFVIISVCYLYICLYIHVSFDHFIRKNTINICLTKLE